MASRYSYLATQVSSPNYSSLATRNQRHESVWHRIRNSNENYNRRYVSMLELEILWSCFFTVARFFMILVVRRNLSYWVTYLAVFMSL